MTIRIALVGASGKLGRIIAGVIEGLDGFEVTARLGSGSDLAEIASVDLVVDATNLEVSTAVVRAALAAQKQVLVATSGWSQQRLAALSDAVDTAGVGVLLVPNFSIGSVLGSALAALAAPFFGTIEIIEAHPDTKIDAPSGTAVRTAELIAAARETPVSAVHPEQPARGEQTAGVPIHSLRRPGVIARQEVVLSGPGESLSIVHDTVDAARAYAPGIRVALQHVMDVRGIVVGLESFLAPGLGR